MQPEFDVMFLDVPAEFGLGLLLLQCYGCVYTMCVSVFFKSTLFGVF